MLFRFGQRPDSAGEASEAQHHFFFSPHLSLSLFFFLSHAQHHLLFLV